MYVFVFYSAADVRFDGVKRKISFSFSVAPTNHSTEEGFCLLKRTHGRATTTANVHVRCVVDGVDFRLEDVERRASLAVCVPL